MRWQRLSHENCLVYRLVRLGRRLPPASLLLFRASTESASSPEAGRALGVFLVLVMLVLASGGGLLLYWAASRQSLVGASILTVFFAFLLVNSFVVERGRGMDDPDSSHRRFARVTSPIQNSGPSH
jgi:hypothetical protein